MRDIIAALYNIYFVPAILDSVRSGQNEVAASVSVTVPVGHLFQMKSKDRLLKINWSLKGTRSPHHTCKCMNRTHLDEDLYELRQALRNGLGDLAVGQDCQTTYSLSDAKYESVELTGCEVTCKLELSLGD